jgi:putative membrane protein
VKRLAQFLDSQIVCSWAAFRYHLVCCIFPCSEAERRVGLIRTPSASAGSEYCIVGVLLWLVDLLLAIIRMGSHAETVKRKGGANRIMSNPLIAYCGPAAVPDDLWTRWNFDPLLIAALTALALVVGCGLSRNARAGCGAVALMVVVFVSPLCALSSALFSVRVFHHVILVAAVAPLLALAFPLRRAGSPPLAALVATHVVILWLWHAPGPYDWGLATVPAYWLMQGSLLGSAWLMWRGILAAGVQPGPALVALVATVGQMGLLGALIVFAARPLYEVHFASTWPWGLSPLADQQLAGLLMWVPAILPYVGVGLWLTWASLRPAEPVR